MVDLRAAFAIVITLVGFLACGSGQSAPKPCLSDVECRGDRICHEGACRFSVEVKRELDAQLSGTGGSTLGAGDGSNLRAHHVADTDEGAVFRMFMQGPAHLGRVTQDGPSEKPKRVEKFYKTAGRIVSAPLVLADRSIVVTSLDRSVTRVSADGKVLWRALTSGSIFASAAQTPTGDIVVGSDAGEVLAFTVDGAPQFRSEVRGKVTGSPVVDAQGSIYVLASSIYKLSARGTVLWEHPLASNAWSSPALVDNVLFVGTSEGDFMTLDTQSGKRIAKFTVGGAIQGGPSVFSEVVDGTRTYYAIFGSDTGKIFGLSSQNLAGKWRKAWEYQSDGPVRAVPAISQDGLAYVGSFDKSLYALDVRNGVLKFKYTTGGRIRGSVLIDKSGRVYFGSQDDSVYCLDSAGTLRFRIHLGQDIDGTLNLDGFDQNAPRLFVGADDGILYRLH